ncbi:DUF1642 domain-containing protein [Streptococcus sp. NLN64]|uniref:DUF1642 domain-containing protein n=1 Tax=Streptococcus sp. NLN64 TaxID=2822799 RepID=UPI0018CAFDCA|nr:DUF1642 domain-containing protein [Streptococcus sp. NLN64]MBG9366536.1 DUF1642 domain-containing protein [Streptococcus sp. NLN64]
MTEKLKYKVGQEILVKFVIEDIDGSHGLYEIETENTEVSTWLTEQVLKSIITDFPPKPKVTKAVMDWYEHHKRSHWNVRNYFMHTPEEIDDWFSVDLQNEHAFVTLITYGPEAVEVEKEKKYFIKFKNTGQVLFKTKDGFELRNYHPDYTNVEDTFTKQELTEAGFEGVFDNPMFEVEEVEQ